MNNSTPKKTPTPLRRMSLLLPGPMVERIEAEAQGMPVPNASAVVREALAKHFEAGPHKVRKA
jgi:hypothetical protein